jgi:hypothetical protein
VFIINNIVVSIIADVLEFTLHVDGVSCRQNRAVRNRYYIFFMFVNFFYWSQCSTSIQSQRTNTTTNNKWQITNK